MRELEEDAATSSSTRRATRSTSPTAASSCTVAERSGAVHRAGHLGGGPQRSTRTRDLDAAEKLERAPRSSRPTTRSRARSCNIIHKLLQAHALYEKDVDYVVQDGPGAASSTSSPAASCRAAAGPTGCTRRSRPRKGCRSRARPRRSPPSPSRTTSACTRSWPGMTGTAETEETGVLRDLQARGGRSFPTNRPIRRIDQHDRIYKTRREKYNAIVEEVERLHEPRPAGARRHGQRRGVGDALAACSSGAGSSTRCSTPSTTSARPRSWPGRGSRARSRSRPTWPAAAPTSNSGRRHARSRRSSRSDGKESSSAAASTSSAPSATSRGASTASCAAAPAARAIRAPRSSSCRSKTT